MKIRVRRGYIPQIDRIMEIEEKEKRWWWWWGGVGGERVGKSIFAME